MSVTCLTMKSKIGPPKKMEGEKTKGRRNGSHGDDKGKPADQSIAGDLYGKFKDLNCLEELSIERAKEIEKEMIWQFSKKFQGEWS